MKLRSELLSYDRSDLFYHRRVSGECYRISGQHDAEYALAIHESRRTRGRRTPMYVLVLAGSQMQGDRSRGGLFASARAWT